jgi:hypothetical protein
MEVSKKIYGGERMFGLIGNFGPWELIFLLVTFDTGLSY